MIGKILLFGFCGWVGYKIACRFFDKRNKKCSCAREGPLLGHGSTETMELGEDPNCQDMTEVTMWKCGACDEFYWLKYLIEQPQYTKAGRYWEVKISAEDADGFTADMARSFIKDQDWCFVGGSYYDQGRHIVKRPIWVG
jgi:hypothetical protein